MKNLGWLGRSVVLVTIYFAIAKLGLRYATIGPSISPVWPPTGLAIAALVLLGLRYWPAILAGAFLATFIGQAIGWYRLDQGAGLIGATVGALIVLFIWNRLVAHHVIRDPGTGGPDTAPPRRSL